MPPLATQCRVCGQPKVQYKSYRLALCMEHLREHIAVQAAKAKAKRNSPRKVRSLTCALCDAPREQSGKYKVVRCEQHLKQWLTERRQATRQRSRQRAHAAAEGRQIEPGPQAKKLNLTCKVCGEPRFFHPSMRHAFCRAHLYEYLDARRTEHCRRKGVRPRALQRQQQAEERQQKAAAAAPQRLREELLLGLYALRRQVCQRDEGCTWEAFKQRDSAREKFRVRYQSDPVFRKLQRIRISARKHGDPARQAEIEGNTRWAATAAAADGTVTAAWVEEQLTAAVSCPLCNHPFDWAVRWRTPSIDHMTPISRGGRHSTSNIHIVCLSCNMAKGDDTLEEYSARPRRRSAEVAA